MKHAQQPHVTGRQLIADFQTVLVSAAAIDAAAYEAERSENELMQYLATSSADGYLQPGDLQRDDSTDVNRASLDAHVKKVQAQQLLALNNDQLAHLAAQDQTDFVGQRVVIEQLDTTSQCIELLWFDPTHGYRSNPTRKKRIAGTIQEVLLEKNILVIKPQLRNRLLSSNLHGYMVYVINPATNMPLVSCSIV